jgi:excisionase family DNA binding protein
MRKNPVFITAEDAAELLDCSRRKLWQLTKDRKIPHVRIGGSVKYERQSLLDWLAQQLAASTK